MQRLQNIAILGAGIMGLSAAQALSARGCAITLYDPAGFPALDSASGVAGGMLVPYAEMEYMDKDWLAAGLAGIKIWQDLLPKALHKHGSLLIAHPQDHYILERFTAHLPETMRTPRNVAALEPALVHFAHGLFIEDEAHMDPNIVMPSLIEMLKARDVRFTPKATTPENLGDTYDRVIDCRGIAAQDQNLRGVKGETVVVHNPAFTLTRPVRLMHPRYPFYIVPRADHVFMIGATQIESEDSDGVSLRAGLELLSALYMLHPSFADAKILALRTGVRPAYPDNFPRIITRDHIISCNGLFRHGYLLSPVMAACVADFIAGKDNQFMPLFTPSCHPERSASEVEGSKTNKDLSTTDLRSFAQDDNNYKRSRQ